MHRDTVTVLRSIDSLKPATKTFKLRDGALVEAETATPYLFRAQEYPVDDLSSLGALLTSLEDVPAAVVIRGQQLDSDPDTAVHRRNVNFCSEPRQWCLIDIDNLELPEEFSDFQAHREDLIRYTIGHLPAEFHGVDCWYQFSSSMGIKAGKIRLHLWFWLSRKVSDQEMKAWLSASPVDRSLY